tara:strand:- start:777 stop:1721 length:945 start_codon:yes stop_codon:yes gene_type:complete
MKNIWVTGARGFLGQHLSKSLIEKKHNVFGIGSYKKFKYKHDNPLFKKFVSGNINKKNLQKLYDIAGSPDIIFHLAGSSSVGESIKSPLLDFKKTVLSTSNLLEFIRKRNLSSKVVFTSSAAVYGDIHNKPITENDKCKPFSPYGCNKLIAEKLFESYANNFNIRSSVIRFFSVYGNGAKKQLIWEICRNLYKNKKFIELFGNGKEIRDWIYINDAVKLLIMASDSPNEESESKGISILNGSSGYHHSVEEIVLKVCELMELNPLIQFNQKTRKGDPNSLIGSNLKTKYLLNFKPDFDIKNGLSEYIQWFRKNN